MRSPDVAAPDRLLIEIADLAGRARRDPRDLYGQLLRENVADAIRCSFPAVARMAGEVVVAAAADAFVAAHPASRPQFHQIATEFVLFAQGQPVLPPALMPLVEYEWVLLQVEIDPAALSGDAAGSTDAAGPVTANPTLRVVMLPFDPALIDANDSLKPAPPRPHGVYRTREHHVLTRPLTVSDCLLLDRLEQEETMTSRALAEAVEPSLSPLVSDWVEQGLADQLLVLADQKDTFR